MENTDMQTITCNRCERTHALQPDADPTHIGLYPPQDWLLNILRVHNKTEQTIDLCMNCKAELLLWIEKGVCK